MKRSTYGAAANARVESQSPQAPPTTETDQPAGSPPDGLRGRFEVVRPLGSGGGGQVVLVRDLRRGGVLRALKTVGTLGEDGPLPSAEAGERLLHEARVLASIVHRGVPRLVEIGREPESGPWILMHYVESETPTEDEDPAHVARGLLDVLGHLHRHGWLHQDVKPANVVVARGRRVVLLDYGFAVREGCDVPPRGTLPYVAPEVLAGEPADARSDLWAAGAVLLQLVLGRQFPPVATLGPDDVPDGDIPLPRDWLRVLLHPRPERRFESAEVALQELEAALGPDGFRRSPRPLPHAPEPAGREAELARLERHLVEARSGAATAATEGPTPDLAGLVLVQGESGVGKSSLLFEMRLRAIAAGWSTVSASCSEERDRPLPALGTLIDAVLRSAPADSPAIERRGRAVASLLAAKGDQSGAETAARFLLERAVECGGILLVVEDLQNATAMTLRVLGAIARTITESHAAGQAPFLMTVASFTEGVPVAEEIVETLAAMTTEELVLSMPVRTLGPAGVAEMVAGILGPRAPAEWVAEVVHAHGGALPLFAEQLLGQLVQGRGLRHDGIRWIVDTKAAPRLPASLTDAVSVRLEALPKRERAALQIVAGHELPLARTRAGMYLGAETAALLAELEAEGLITPTGDGSGVTVVHSVIGQAALKMLSPRGRAKLHDLLARGIVGHGAATEIRRAYHVARGTDPDKGFQAATSAARRLRGDGEPGRAADCVRQALRTLDESDPRVPHVRRSLAELLVSSGRPAAAANVYRDLLDAETDTGARVRLLLGLVEALDSAGQATDVEPACRGALDLIEEPGTSLDPAERGDLRLQLLARMASAQRGLGDLRGAIETVRGALPLAGEGRGAERATLLTLLGNVYLQLGELGRARQFHESCLAACRALGRRRGMATALHNLGVVSAQQGRAADAAASYRQSLRLARRAKDLQGVAQTLGNLANLRAEHGDFTEAEQLQRRSLALRRRIGDLAGIAVTTGNLAGLYRARGRLGTALTLLHTATRRLRALGDARGEVQFLIQMADIHLLADDLVGVRPLLIRALSRAASASLRSHQAVAEMLLGRLESRLDPHSDAAQAHLQAAARLHEEAGDRAGLAEVMLETALADHARNRRGTAIKSWRAAKDIAAEHGPADLRARVDLVRGRLDADREASDEALAALQRFHRYVHAAGRRDYRATAAYALARGRFSAGDRDGASTALAEAIQCEDDLQASLPPALRGTRAAGAKKERLDRLADEMALLVGSGSDATPEAAREDEMDQERLFKLLEINKKLALATDVRGLLDTIMDVATEATGAERGFLILVDDAKKISFQTARNFRREEVPKPELKVSRTLVTRVMKSGQPILTDNATEDQRFSEFESVERLELKSIISVPFRLGEETIGALYLDNPARNGQFGTGDLQFLTALGDQAALAIRNLRQAESMQQLNRQLEHNLEQKSAELEQASRALAERATKYPYTELIGESPQMHRVLLLVDKVVDTEVPVLVHGESGTGKELIARALHQYGRRKAGPFVTVNCGAITESLMESELFGHVRGSFTGAHEDKQGLFSAADGGTIFLDEIGEMSFDMQKKLLRVLQEREVRAVGGKDVKKVDVRVISATNRDLRKMMGESTFREDLYYRIAVISIAMPPLRDRDGDIRLLIEHMADRAAIELGLTRKAFDADALDAMAGYAWPGNVRELDNEVKKALTLSDDRVTLEDLSFAIQGERAGPEPELVRPEAGRTLKENLEKMERALIEKALDHTGGNQTRAAKDLGISRVWLRKKMEKHGLFDR